MSEPKWSKGPWYRGEYDKLFDVNGERVSMDGLGAPNVMQGGTDKERANATLCVAAPALYSALEQFLNSYIKCSPDPHRLKAHLASGCRICNGYAALAKARGEA